LRGEGNNDSKEKSEEKERNGGSEKWNAEMVVHRGRIREEGKSVIERVQREEERRRLSGAEERR